MRILILSVFTLLIGLSAKAQSNTASLNITLTDIQSVTFTNTSLSSSEQASQDFNQEGSLKMLSQSTSQVKKISSRNADYDRLYKELYSTSSASSVTTSGKSLYGMVSKRNSGNLKAPQQSKSNLVIYQIDPR